MTGGAPAAGGFASGDACHSVLGMDHAMMADPNNSAPVAKKGSCAGEGRRCGGRSVRDREPEREQGRDKRERSREKGERVRARRLRDTRGK